MSLPVVQNNHFWELIHTHKSILIALPQYADGDCLASALALYSLLKTNTPQVDIVCDLIDGSYMSFLPEYQNIKKEIPVSRKLALKVMTNRTGIKNFYYDSDESSITCYFEPREGFFNENDISIVGQDYFYDLIITINAPELNSLGAVYTRATNLFFEIPVINLGITTSNTHYGSLAIVDVTKSTMSELVYSIIHETHEQSLSSNISTMLLAGIISGTRSFRSARVTPYTMKIASDLVQQGADKDTIIHQLYRTKSVSQMKLWGKALARLAHDMPRGILWTHITPDDLVSSHADRRDIEYVISELISTTAGALVIIVGVDHSDHKHVVVHTNRSINALSLLKKFTPTGDSDHCVIHTTDDIEQCVYNIIDELRQHIPHV